MAKTKKDERKIVFLNKYTKGKTIDELLERLTNPNVVAPLFKLAQVLDFKTNFDYDLLNNNDCWFWEIRTVKSWLVWVAEA